MGEDVEFQMPATEVGDVVLHWQGSESRTPLPAIVISVGNRGVTLKIMTPNRDTVIRTGVPHKDDPVRKKLPRDEAGFWDYRPAHKRLLELIRQMESRTNVTVAKSTRGTADH